jgi:CheY-like chemotaxis protein
VDEAVGHGQDGRLARISRRRILVVDDHEDSANSLGALLQLSGADVRTAYDGETALEAIESYRPSIVFLDIGLPGMDGYEVGRQARAKSSDDRNLTLIALTGWGQDESVRRSKDAGIDHHLVKPVDYDALIDLLSSLPIADDDCSRERVQSSENVAISGIGPSSSSALRPAERIARRADRI